MNLLHKLKVRYSEAYRIRIGCGLSPIRNKRELKALVKFCKYELKEPSMALNPYRKRLFEATIDLADIDGRLVELPLEFTLENGKKREYINVSEIIDEHTGWYWS